MDIRKATAAQMVTPKYGFAIFETDWKGNPCKPTAHFLIKQTKKLGKVGECDPWYQWTPGWYVSTLLERPIQCKNLHDEDEVGLYIDFGQNWFIPAGPVDIAQDYFKEYLDEGIRRIDTSLVEAVAKESF